MGYWLIQWISSNRFGSEPQPAHFVIFLGHTLLIQGASLSSGVSVDIQCAQIIKKSLEIAEGRGVGLYPLTIPL